MINEHWQMTPLSEILLQTPVAEEGQWILDAYLETVGRRPDELPRDPDRGAIENLLRLVENPYLLNPSTHASHCLAVSQLFRPENPRCAYRLGRDLINDLTAVAQSRVSPPPVRRKKYSRRA